jgi:hypothetical protein
LLVEVFAGRRNEGSVTEPRDAIVSKALQPADADLFELIFLRFSCETSTFPPAWLLSGSVAFVALIYLISNEESKQEALSDIRIDEPHKISFSNAFQQQLLGNELALIFT